MRALLSGSRFAASGPHLVLDELGGMTALRHQWPISDKPLTLEITDARRCTGWFDLITYESHPCPEQSAISPGFDTCFECFRRTGFNPSFYNVPMSTLSPQQRTYNERPHVVYLAYFADGWAKVGISSRDRVTARLRGQGARLATVVFACDDAYQARALEERIVRDAAIPETVRGSRKRALVNEPLDAERGAHTLAELRQRVEDVCQVRALPLDVHDCTRDYLGDHKLDLPVTDLTDEKPASISGVAVGMIGDILVVEDSGRQFMLSVKEFFGSVVTLEETVRRNVKRPDAGQLGFGFL
ncbi:MAG TPA: DUF2797 domain-containing protein [Polyangiaceae bacterium]